MRRHQRARRWVMQELDYLSNERQRTQSHMSCPTTYKSATAESLFECDYLAASWTGIGLSRASTPDRLAANAMRAAETSRRPARSRSSPPQCPSQPKLRSTTQRPASTTKPV